MVSIFNIISSGRQRWVGIVLCFSLLLIVATPLQTAAAGAISQGFQTSNTKITSGELLSLGNSQGTVIPTTSNNVVNMVGIAGSKPLLELSGSGKDVQVVVSGLTQALVSNVNGNIKAGDKITASPFAGIGMKAISPTEVVGVAQANLNSVQTIQQKVTDRQGETQLIEVGIVPIQVNVLFYSSTGSTASLLVPPFLQAAANTLSGGKNVSPIRVLASALTLLLGFVTISVILYASIRSSIISIGRNPLANSALRKGLVDILIMAIGILSITLITTYIVVTS